MKPRFYFFAIVMLAMVCAVGLHAQGLETVGGPYTVDTNTVSCCTSTAHMSNAAAAVGKTDTAASPAHHQSVEDLLPEQHRRSGMGKCVRLDNGAITDSTYLTVADTAALDLTGQLDHRSMGEHLHVRRQFPGLSLGSACVHETRRRDVL